MAQPAWYTMPISQTILSLRKWLQIKQMFSLSLQVFFCVLELWPGLRIRETGLVMG